MVIDSGVAAVTKVRLVDSFVELAAIDSLVVVVIDVFSEVIPVRVSPYELLAISAIVVPVVLVSNAVVV